MRTLIALLATALTALAQGPEITGYDNGTLTFSSSANPNEYFTLEFSPTLENPAWTNWGSVSDQPITGAVMSVSTPMYFRIKQVTKAPSFAGMALIPAGVNEGTDPDFGAYSLTNETAFYMDVYEVTWSLWDKVRQWGLNNEYTDLPEGRKGSTGNATHINHPVMKVSWYDAVKWCNARSEMEGLEPCYYATSAQTTVYRTGIIVDLQADTVDWTANGYRLPTEWEWEYAARGGLEGQRYPWGDEIDGSKANYRDSSDPYDNGTTPVGYYNGGQWPAGADMGQAGLYDMSGNAYEWTWNFFEGTSGPRVLRGGSWYGLTRYLRCGHRLINYPVYRYDDFGFRCARGL